MTDFLESMGSLALGNRFKRVVDRLMQDASRVYQESGLRFEPRWVPLYCFLLQSGPTRMTAIARGLGVSHVSISQIAGEMASADLVATYKDQRDRRRRVLALTRKAKELSPQLEQVWRDLALTLDEVLEAAGPDFLDRLSALEKAAFRKEHQRGGD